MKRSRNRKVSAISGKRNASTERLLELARALRSQGCSITGPLVVLALGCNKAAELASDEMTAALARNLGPEAITKTRATAAFFHVFDRVREYGHPVESLTELMGLVGNVYTRKALLGHVDSMRQIVDRMKAIPTTLLKHVVSVRYTDREGRALQQQAGPVVENNRLRRQVEQQQIEINRLNQRLAAIGFKPRKGKRK